MASACICGISGQLLNVDINGSVVFNTSGLASGTYFYKLDSGKAKPAGKIVVE